MEVFKLIGAIGLLLITAGILSKKRKNQDILYIVGGACLEVYSLYIGDLIFIILQIVFIIAAIYDLWKIKNKN